jgi:hemolysin III
MGNESERESESYLQRICPVTGHTILEELINSLTHGLAAILAVVGFGFLIFWAAEYRGTAAVFGVSVYGASLVSLFGASALYHGWYTRAGKRLFQMVDHACIYLLIAGTYTPIALGPLSEQTSGMLLWLLWGIAVVGVGIKLCQWIRNPWLNAAIYLGMSWLVVINIGPLMDVLSPSEFSYMVTGGLLYTGGCLFYVWKAFPYNHAVWHLFVIAGSACHYCLVASTVFPG